MNRYGYRKHNINNRTRNILKFLILLRRPYRTSGSAFCIKNYGGPKCRRPSPLATVRNRTPQALYSKPLVSKPLHAPSPRSKSAATGGSNGERLEHLQHCLVPHLRAESVGALSQEPEAPPHAVRSPGPHAPVRSHRRPWQARPASCGTTKAALSTCCGADSARTFSGSSSISMHLV